MIVSKNTKILEIPIFGSSFILVDTKKKYDYMLAQNPILRDITPAWRGVNGWCSYYMGDDGAYFVLGITKREFSIIVHESTHLVHYMMKYKGIPVNHKNTEIQAYLIAYVVDLVQKNIGGKKK